MSRRPIWRNKKRPIIRAPQRCTQCGTASVDEGYCPRCRAQDRALYARRRRHGACVQCGRLHSEITVRCPACCAYQRAAQQRWRTKQRKDEP